MNGIVGIIRHVWTRYRVMQKCWVRWKRCHMGMPSWDAWRLPAWGDHCFLWRLFISGGQVMVTIIEKLFVSFWLIDWIGIGIGIGLDWIGLDCRCCLMWLGCSTLSYSHVCGEFSFCSNILRGSCGLEYNLELTEAGKARRNQKSYWSSENYRMLSDLRSVHLCCYCSSHLSLLFICRFLCQLLWCDLYLRGLHNYLCSARTHCLSNVLLWLESSHLQQWRFCWWTWICWTIPWHRNNLFFRLEFEFRSNLMRGQWIELCCVFSLSLFHFDSYNVDKWIGPGFFGGMATGGLLGYLFGNRNNGYYNQGYHRAPTYGSSSSWGSRSSGHRSSPSSSPSNHRSTSYAQTKRR